MMAETFDWRCAGIYLGRPCNRLLGKFADLRRGEVKCPRCGAINRANWPGGKPQEQQQTAQGARR